jgi:hypothetical protein
VSLRRLAGRHQGVPNGRRSDRINRRDLEALEFVARFGTVPREVLSTWSGSGRSVSYERERRLRAAGLIEILRGLDGRLLIATSAGRRACRRTDLPAGRPSPASLRHEMLLAALGARLELAGEEVLSEREIGARERAEGTRLFSASMGRGRFHRPDLIRLEGAGATAIEVELTVKAAARLDSILRAWRFAVAEGRLAHVTYHCAPRARPFVEKAIARTATAGAIGTIDLET